MQPKWFFERVQLGMTERNPVSDQFFTNDTRLEAIIRESIQNSLDARMDFSKPVEVYIYFSSEEGQLPASKFARYMKAEVNCFGHPKNGLLKPIPRADEDCQYLVIEDFNTTGLTGRVDEKPIVEDVEHRNDWNYYNYFFRENGSTKVGANTRGSWGAGKCVFQRASRLKVSFAYSVRDDYEPREFVVGKTTLQIYEDENRNTWSPDGWFGIKLEESIRAPHKIPQLPITDSGFIQMFKEDFNITRKNEPGTSIVIPHVHLATDSESENATFNTENLVRSVLRNFIVAIHSQDLTVTVRVGKSNNSLKIDKSFLANADDFLPTPEMKDVLLTNLHHKLLMTVFDTSFSEKQCFTLNPPDVNLKWEKKVISEEQLLAIQKLFHEKKPCLITIPMPIRKKTDNGIIKVDAKFKLLIQRVDLPKSLRPIFYRAGLLIPEATSAMLNNHIAMILIEQDELANLLVSAEPPSHSEWAHGADRVKKGYEAPRSHIQYVTTAARKIIDSVAMCDRKANYDPLNDIFGIKKQKSESPNEAGKKTGDKPGTTDPEEPSEVISNLKRIDFSQIDDGETGFKVSEGEGLASIEDEKFPFTASFKIGYDTFHGLDWDQNDFDLSNSSEIKIKKELGDVTFEAEDNRVVFTIPNKKPFIVKITGFDANRDINIDQVTYKDASIKEDE